MKLLRFEPSNHLLGCGALALTLALGRAEVAAQAFPVEIGAASPPAETESATANATGSGTVNHLARWTSGTALGDSVITQIQSKIGIGDSNPATKLSVKGADASLPTIRGMNTSSGKGVAGVSASGTGVSGMSTSGTAVQGTVTGANNTHAAVLGETNSTSADASGVTGLVTSGNAASSSAGVRGDNQGTGHGVEGTAAKGAGVYGHIDTDSYGTGVAGESRKGLGVYGVSDSGGGIFGSSASGIGVQGSSAKSYGVSGFSPNSAGVVGQSTSSTGVAGVSGSGSAITGKSTDGYGVYGTSTNGFAGYFDGNVHVNGTLSKSAGSFQIDHPLDPANEYLSHSFVESPEMKNIYDGNVTTDADGFAVVQMPSYFSALNRDFRYQLTVIGDFAQAVVSEKMKENSFRIRTSKPKVEVSWQVTGVRHDAYAEAHRVQVEEPKALADRGRYLFPLGFGQPESATIGRPELAAQVAPSAGPSGGGR